MPPHIRPSQSEADIRASFPVMRELRSHFTAADDYVAAVTRQMADGYRLALRFVDGARGEEVVACAGWRFSEMLAYGKFLYVDDLVTAERHRSQGHGEALIGWLEAEARRAGCRVLSLDSGTQRTAAHRFYFREGLIVSSFHFVKRLD